MGYIIEGYKLMAQGFADWVKRNRSHIGTGVSVTGTLVSNILAAKAGAKSSKMIEQKEEELGRPLDVKEKVGLCWKNHIPHAGTAAAACAGAVYSDNQHVKDFNKVATAYGTVKSLLDTTKAATKEALGEKKNLELVDKINKKKLENDPEFKKRLAEMPPNPDPEHNQRFYEQVSGEVIWSTMDKVKNAIKIMGLEMKAMPVREPNKQFGRRGKYGIKLVRFFDLVDWNLPGQKYNSKVMQEFGFNKGQQADGTEDDRINATFTPMLIEGDDGEEYSAICINWDVDPSDMNYGDYMKS